MLTSAELSEAVDAFLVSRTVAGCTSRTVQLYREVLTPFVRDVSRTTSECSLPVVQTYLTRLRERVSPTTAHLHLGLLSRSLT